MTEEALTFQANRFPWWLILLQGIAAVILGAMLFAAPGATVFFLVQVMGWYWLIKGIFDIVSIFIDHSAWGWKLFMGILGIIAGVLVVQHPLWSTALVPTVLAIIVGIQGIIGGIIGLIMAFKGGGWAAAILGGLSIVFGLVLLFNPLASAVVLVFVAGGFAIVGGIAAIVMAFRYRAA